MTFASAQFAAFFLLVLGISWQLRNRVAQNTFLLLASWWFYALFDWRFLGLMWLSTVVDFALARRIAGRENPAERRRLLVISLVVNLGVLGAFKYYNFFVASGSRFLQMLGVQESPPLTRVILPVGISFYTFHGISYVFDVYRRQLKPAQSLLDYSLFVAFFPQQLAGPIGRAHLQLPQFERHRPRPSADGIASGGVYVLLGLFKKVAIAGALAPIVDRAFDSPSTSGWIALVVGAAAFSLEIYADFSGYSDIARGTGRLLGIDLPVNFLRPYFSPTITAFWRRWHISLSSWLRDYLYIPMGGSRGRRWSTYRNIVVTMTLGGLWHGAAWTFVVWGTAHGILLALDRWRNGHAGARTPSGNPTAVLSVFATLGTVTALFIVFRATSLGAAATYLTRIVTVQSGPYSLGAAATLAYATICLAVLDRSVSEATGESDILSWPPLACGAAIAFMTVAIAVFSGGPRVPFIYFQF